MPFLAWGPAHRLQLRGRCCYLPDAACWKRSRTSSLLAPCSVRMPSGSSLCAEQPKRIAKPNLQIPFSILFPSTNANSCNLCLNHAASAGKAALGSRCQAVTYPVQRSCLKTFQQQHPQKRLGRLSGSADGPGLRKGCLQAVPGGDAGFVSFTRVSSC